MAKSNRATRKELEKVVGQMIEELTTLRRGFQAIDSYLDFLDLFPNKKKDVNSQRPDDWKRARRDQRRRRRQEKEYGYDVSYCT